MRGATVQVCRADCGCAVSIHAPHAGRDPSILRRGFGGSRFNPRAPCGARHPRTLCTICILSFNPRAPCGARRDTCKQNRGDICFNPRAPCGARQAALHHRRRHVRFNPRAPCGARRGACRAIYLAGTFQSTRPMRGATLARRKGGITKKFQSTRPMRGATLPCACTASPLPVSIHAPHAGRDRGGSRCCAPTPSFNPRAPCGARRAKVLLFAVM